MSLMLLQNNVSFVWKPNLLSATTNVNKKPALLSSAPSKKHFSTHYMSHLAVSYRDPTNAYGSNAGFCGCVTHGWS